MAAALVRGFKLSFTFKRLSENELTPGTDQQTGLLDVVARRYCLWGSVCWSARQYGICRVYIAKALSCACAERMECRRGAKKPRMTDGTATGLITAGALTSEMDRKREMERQRFNRKGAADTGRGAGTVSLRCPGHVWTACAIRRWAMER